MMKELEKFKEIFEGLDCAYGITKKSTQFTEKGKNKTESFTIHKPPIKQLWNDHLIGKDPALAIIPINNSYGIVFGSEDGFLYLIDKSIIAFVTA